MSQDQQTGEAVGGGKAKKSKLLNSSLVVSAMTMISRVMGLIRDIVFAWFIGASGGADAFFVAFKIPNFLRRLFAEGAFAQAFVPVLSEYRQKGSIDAVRHLIAHVSGCLGIAVASISALAVVGAPVLTFLFASGFYWQEPEKFALTVDLIRITFPYLALISMAGFVSAVLNSYERFAIPAITPVILNVVLITAAVWVSPMMEEPAHALAWGVLVAGVCQFSFQLPFLYKARLLVKPKVDWRDKSVRRVLALMAPALFGVSISQINLLLDTVLASWLVDGSVSWLYYSDRLIELPLGVFGVAIATVVLPALSRQHTDACTNYSATLDWALRTVLFISVPATVALMVLAKPIITTLFQYGDRFSEHTSLMSSYSLIAYALGLSAFMLIKVLVTGYFSRQDTKTPVKIGIQAMLWNMLFNVILVVPLHFYWGIGHVGLALATAGSAFFNASMLLKGLISGGFYQIQVGWKKYFSQLLFSAVSMGAVLIGIVYVLPNFSVLTMFARVSSMTILCLAGLSTFMLSMYLLGWRLHSLKPAD